MEIGITSPIVTANPGVHSAWEASAGIIDLAEIAAAADELGFDHITCSEHVAVPADLAEERGGTYWDPLATLAFLAARTNSIRLVTQVLVLGYHHPLEIAKRYGTLDVVSDGRLVLGVGVGSIEEEFRLLGATWEGRGSVADDALAALRASMGKRMPSYHGEYYEYSGFVVDPHAQQASVPIWVGGYTPRSLRRAASLGDGWMPFGLRPEMLRDMLARTELPPQFEVVLAPNRQLDPSGDPERTLARLRRLKDAGATLVTTTIEASSAGHYCEQLEALSRLRLEVVR